MTRPLRSAPITEASPLLRAGPPARTATRAEPPLIATGHRRVASGDGFGARLLPFRSGAAGRVHVASMPDTTWPVGGHPPGSSREPTARPRFICRVALFRHVSSDSLALVSPTPACHLDGCLFLDRSPQQSSANAARGGLKPPPAGRLRRAYLHHPNSTNYSASDHLPTHRTPFTVRDTRHCKVSISGLTCSDGKQQAESDHPSHRSGGPPAWRAVDGSEVRAM